MIVEFSNRGGYSTIHHWYRKGQKKIHRVIDDFKPYFYVLTKNYTKFPGIIAHEDGYKSLFGDDLTKVICDKSSTVSQVKNNFGLTFESDVLFTNRFIIDRDPIIGDMPKVMYLDIEVLHEKGIFPEPKEAKYPIVSITFASNYSDKYITLFYDNTYKGKEKVVKDTPTRKIIIFDNERDLLLNFAYYLKIGDPDILTGWNVHGFDLPYKINRFKNKNLNPNILSPLGYVTIPPPRMNMKTKKYENRQPIIKGRTIFDLIMPFKKINITELESNTLDNVAEKILGIKKLEYEGDLVDLYNRDKKKFVEYNYRDVYLSKGIDKKVGIISYFFDLSSFIGCQIGDTLSYSKIGDIFRLKHTKHITGIILPSRKHTVSTTFKGAIVNKSIFGLHRYVIVLDLNKIYPSIIISCMFSPEYYYKYIEKYKEFVVERDIPKYVKFCTEEYEKTGKKPFTSEILLKLFKIRDKKKAIKKKFKIGTEEYDKAQREEQYVKDMINAQYGLLAYEGDRLYIPDIGAGITFMGRKINLFSQKKIEDKGYKVIYSDTDSIFFYAKTNNPKKEGKELEKYLNNSFDEFASKFNIKKHIFGIEFEKIYKSLFFGIKDIKKKIGSKKRYAGILCYKDGEDLDLLEIKGMESKRSDDSKYIKETIKNTIEKILNFIKEDDIKEYIEEKVKGYRQLDLNDIGIRKGINQEITAYKTRSAHIRGCEYANKYFFVNYNKGNKPMYLYVKQKKDVFRHKYKDTYVIAYEDKDIIPPDFWKEFEPDYNKMIESGILHKLAKIYAALNWNFNVLDVREQKTLLGFQDE